MLVYACGHGYGEMKPCDRYLESRTTPDRFCDKPGHRYCEQHQREMDAMEQADKNWDEILATHRAVCEEETEREQQLCAVCNRRPVHTAFAKPMSRVLA